MKRNRSRIVRWAWWTALVTATLVVPAFWLDKAVSRALVPDAWPGDLLKLVMLSEAFAHTFGVAAILIAVWLLDADSARRLPLLLAATLGSGIPVQLVKRIVGRLRPSAWNMEGPIGDSFVGCCPWRTSGWEALSDASIQSFPSAHTALAVALGWGLSWAYPRGRWLFGLLAVLAGLQRVVAHAHYLSDVLAGAALGTLAFALCADPRFFGKWLDPDSPAPPPTL